MYIDVEPSDLRTQISTRFAEGEEGQWESHASAEALVEYYLNRNRGQEEPQDESTVLRYLYAWMGEQLELTRYLIEQSTPEAQAAYARHVESCHVQEQQAMLENAARYEASRGPYDDYVTVDGSEDDYDDERGDSEY